MIFVLYLSLFHLFKPLEPTGDVAFRNSHCLHEFCQPSMLLRLLEVASALTATVNCDFSSQIVAAMSDTIEKTPLQLVRVYES